MTVLKGKDLDKAIEQELILITTEANVEDITPTLVHQRLKSKGIVKGQVSTLSTSERKALINKYREEYLSGLGLNEKEKELVRGRNTKQAYIERIQRLTKDNEELQKQLSINTYTMLAIIRMLKTQTTLPIEEVLSPYLLRELRKLDIKE